MGRKSSREDKNAYQVAREILNLTRSDASDLLDSGISAERIEKIESEKVVPHPDEVLIMADKYKAPHLCNYFCSNQCSIGQKYVPEIETKELSQIVLGAISTLNTINSKKDRLVDITADGEISNNEIAEFYEIQQELEKISLIADTLKLWSEKMLFEGKINQKKYEEYKVVKKGKK